MAPLDFPAALTAALGETMQRALVVLPTPSEASMVAGNGTTAWKASRGRFADLHFSAKLLLRAYLALSAPDRR